MIDWLVFNTNFSNISAISFISKNSNIRKTDNVQNLKFFKQGLKSVKIVQKRYKETFFY